MKESPGRKERCNLEHQAGEKKGDTCRGSKHKMRSSAGMKGRVK